MLSFMHIINKVRDIGCEATLEVDRIFAFLGHPQAPVDICVDYSAPPEKAFLEMTPACLADADDPQIVSCVYHKDNVAIDRGPSWVPKWCFPNPCLQIGRIAGYCVYRAGDCGLRSKQFKNYETTATTRVHNCTITVRSFELGHIKSAPILFRSEMFQPYPFTSTYASVLLTILDNLPPTPRCLYAFVLKLLTGGSMLKWPSSSTPLGVNIYPSESTFNGGKFTPRDPPRERLYAEAQALSVGDHRIENGLATEVESFLQGLERVSSLPTIRMDA